MRDIVFYVNGVATRSGDFFNLLRELSGRYFEEYRRIVVCLGECCIDDTRFETRLEEK